MKTRKLGNSALEFSVIGLGTWAIGGDNWGWSWGEQDDAQSIQTIQYAIDLGINWIDTAPIYGLGHSEKIVGKAIRGRRDKVYIATKCGYRWDHDKKEISNNLKPSSIRNEIEDSLKRLDVDEIDLYLIHSPIPEEDIEDAWIVVTDLIIEGKIRYAGVSNFNKKQLERTQSISPITALQPPYSMFSREIDEEILPYTLKENIGVIAYWPLQAGILTDKFNLDYFNSLGQDDWRRDNKDFKEPLLGVNIEYKSKLQEISHRHEKKLSQLAIAWVLAQKGVTSAIVGVRNKKQLEENIIAAEWMLDETELKAISELLVDRQNKLAFI